MNKLKLSIVLLIIITLVVVSWITTTSEVIIYKDEAYELSADIPYISIAGFFYPFKVAVKSSDSIIDAEILFKTFDRPLFFLFLKNMDALIVIYWFDIEDLVFVIESGNVSEKGTDRILDNKLDMIVDIKDNLTVRRANNQEVNYLISEIEKMPQEKYEQLSIPHFDIGIYKRYLSKQRILNILKEKSDERDKG
jgi:hypothetical protein